MSTIPALLSKECSTRIFPDGFLSIYEPRQAGLNFGEQMGRSVSLLMRAVLAWLIRTSHLAIAKSFSRLCDWPSEIASITKASAKDHLNLASETTCRHFIKYQELYLSLMPNCSV